MLRTVLVLLGVWLCAAGTARASVPLAPQPRQISVADGLPSNRVNDLVEDRHGYLWIATRDGLARYDGVGYRVWRADDGLRDNFIWTVHVDAADRIWVGTQNAGLGVLDPDRRSFRHFDRSSHPQIGSDDIWAVASTPDGNLWFGTSDGGLHRLSPQGAITRFMPKPGDPRSLPSASVGQLVAGKDGTLWVGTKAGVARWTGRDFERLPAAALPSPLVNGLTLEADGTLWIGTTGGTRVRRPNGRIEQVPWRDAVLDQPVLHMLLRDRDGMSWLDTSSGLGREQQGAVSDVPLYSVTSRGVVRPAWSRAYQDREGGLWFASSDTGLWHLPANWRQFTVLSRRVNDPATPANAYVHGVAPAADGGLWLVGSGGVLDWLDPATGAIEHRVQDVGDSYVPYGVHQDHAGQVWVGYLQGLLRFDPRSGQSRRWDAQSPSDVPPAGDISLFAQTGDGVLWLASERAVQARDADGRVLESIARGDGRGLQPNALVEQLGTAPDGALWLAGSQGLLTWNAGARRFEAVAGVSHAHVHGFALGKADTVWLARMGALESYRWDGAQLQLQQRIDAAQGMPSVAPGGVLVDAVGVVWLTSVRGLIRFDPRTRTLRVFGVRDGLPSQEFSERPPAQSLRGHVAVGTADGLVLYHPDYAQSDKRSPTLVIESVEVRRGDQTVELASATRFELQPDDRDLRVTARLLSFTNAHAHRYRFRLAGYDRDWIEVGTSGERLFPRLAPRAYRLGVQARTADHRWSPVQELVFEIRPPWWRTPWAIAGFIGLALLLLWWLADAYRDRLKRRHAMQLTQRMREIAEQASLAKTRFLATLGHEVRTPMTGVLGMSELLLGTKLDPQQRGYTESISRAGNHLLRLVNDALDLARIESGKLELDAQPFVLRALVDDVAALMAPLAGQKGFQFEATVSDDAPIALHGDSMRIRQILMNLLGNAIKFTEHGEVRLCVHALSPQGVRFEVADTGPGLNDEQKARLFRRFEQAEGSRTAARYGGSGLGLAISQELAAAMDGTIVVDSTPGQGARFTVDLPLAAASMTAAPNVAATSSGTVPALDLLLVEDDATVAEVIAGLLRAQGHRVTHVAHGLAALAETAGARFDVGLLDLDLPGLDGLALARQLRAQGFSAPLLAVTARADAEAEPLARDAGFGGFLRKPLTGEMLAEAIEAIGPDTGSRPTQTQRWQESPA